MRQTLDGDRIKDDVGMDSREMTRLPAPLIKDDRHAR